MPFRVLISLLITYLLRPPTLQVNPKPLFHMYPSGSIDTTITAKVPEDHPCYGFGDLIPYHSIMVVYMLPLGVSALYPSWLLAWFAVLDLHFVVVGLAGFAVVGLARGFGV